MSVPTKVFAVFVPISERKIAIPKAPAPTEVVAIASRIKLPPNKAAGLTVFFDRSKSMEINIETLVKIRTKTNTRLNASSEPYEKKLASGSGFCVQGA